MIVLACSRYDLRRRWVRWLKGSDDTIEVADREAMERTLEGHKPALLLLDLGSPKLNGIDGVAAIHSACPSTKILCFTKTPNDREAVRALKAGAKGYSHCRVTPAMFTKAVREVRRGEVWVDRHVISRLVDELASQSQSQVTNPRSRLPNPLRTLTDRQREVAQLVGVGAANKEIAQRLGVTERTVKAHITFIFRRLGVSDRLRLALLVSGVSKRAS